MPDFDIDFCQDRRDEVIRYVRDKYGGDRVASIITFGKLQARAVLRDVGRALGMPYGQVDRVAKLVPFNPAHPPTLEQALVLEPRLAEAAREDEQVGRLIAIAQQLEGLPRHASTHAAGVVIGDRPLDELVPLYRDPRADMPVTQFNMKDVEKAGLVKFDFLGLTTLTLLSLAERLVNQRGRALDLATLPLDDPATFELLGRGETAGVFQLESGGMRDALRKLKPDCFDDIVAMNALYRPGPMDNIPRYINCKHGTEQPEYLHPLLEPILKETYGVIIYQEQVMQIARELAGYSLGGADLLRRAMGKKIKAEMDAQREVFIDGAIRRGVGQRLSDHDLRAGREVRVLRLPQGARHRLRAARLSDRVSQGEPPGRVLRGGDDHGPGQPGQAEPLSPGDRALRDPPAAARRQPWRRQLHGRGRAGWPGASATRSRRSAGSACRRSRRWSRSGKRGRAVRRHVRHGRPDRRPGAQPTAAGGPDPGRRAGRLARQPAPRCWTAWSSRCVTATRTRRRRPATRPACSAA